jgi:predicted AAA+ superfamily ATPase
MIERDQLQAFTKRILEPRKFIQVLMGPRQVGKTTMADQGRQTGIVKTVI